MRSYLKKLSITFALMLSLLTASCNPSVLSRAVNIIESVKPSIKALHRQNEAEILSAVDEIIAGIKVFRDNPTRSNYKNALAVIDRQIEQNIFGFSPAVMEVIAAGRALLAGILPPEDASAMRAGVAMDEKVSIRDLKESDLERLERAAAKLKAETKK